MDLLVLAYSKSEDLPENWEEFQAVDAFGEVQEELEGVQTHNHFFTAKTINKQYQECFIKHPDPWGEPRNWMQAINGISLSLTGKLICEFWFPHEVKAFHFLLKKFTNPTFLEIKEINQINNKRNFQAVWEIKATDKDQYQELKHKVLKEFYAVQGKHLADYSIEEIEILCKK